MYRNKITLFLITWLMNDLEGLKIDDDLVSWHGDVVRQRMSEVRQFLVPLPDDQFDRLYRHFGSLLIPINAESEVCRNHSLHLLQNFLDSQNEIWALRMVDASSKIQSGILDGNLVHLGHYSQCISVDEPNKLFRGQHCVIETDGFLPPEISDAISRKGMPFSPVDVMLSLCVPSSCSDRDVLTHVERTFGPLLVTATSYFDPLHLSTDIPRISCSSANSLPFRTKDYCAMAVFASLALVVVLATYMGANSGWLSHFSLLTNYKELVGTAAAPDEVTCLNGLRVLLMILIHYVHRVILLLLAPSAHLLTNVKIYTSLTMDLVEFFGMKTVDVYFLVGGCVLSYNFFIKYKYKEDNFSFVNFCLRRYFRVTPLLAVWVLYEASLFVHSGSGPLWLYTVAPFEDKCYVNWWTTLLHISDLANADFTCVGESWYIACDYKLQCFAPVLLLLLLRRPRLGLTCIVVCIISSLALVFLLASYAQFATGYMVSFIFMDRLTYLHVPFAYRLVFFRGSTFFMGLILGFIMFHFKQSKHPFSLSKRAAWLGWTLCLATLVSLSTLAVKLMEPGHQFVPVLDPLFFTFSRPIFCACVAWIIFACHYNGGGYVNKFLSWRGFRPLARLVFSFYLCHLTFLYLYLFSIEAPVNFRYKEQIFLWLGDMVISFLVAAVLYLTIEQPFYKLANSIITDWGRNSKLKKT